MSWNAAKASTWMRRYADELASDAYKDEGNTFFYACAGAAYYAVYAGVGYNTEQEFRAFVRDHFHLGEDFADGAVKEIRG
jgi:hypothetical protein